jgi:hypothetical protein
MVRKWTWDRFADWLDTEGYIYCNPRRGIYHIVMAQDYMPILKQIRAFLVKEGIPRRHIDLSPTRIRVYRKRDVCLVARNLVGRLALPHKRKRLKCIIQHTCEF